MLDYEYLCIKLPILVAFAVAVDFKNFNYSFFMKKTYLTPESRVKDLWLDSNFLATIGGTGGENLDDPTTFDPWS